MAEISRWWSEAEPPDRGHHYGCAPEGRRRRFCCLLPPFQGGFIFALGSALAPTTFPVSSKLTLHEAEYGVIADALVANSYEPFVATGDKAILKRLTQFKPLAKYLSAGANEALKQK